MRFTARTLATMTVATLLTPALHAEDPKHLESTSAREATTTGAAQQPVAAYPKKTIRFYPRTELFLGYSYLRAAPTYATGNRLVSLNGGSASLAYNYTRYFGLVTDFGGFADNQVDLTGPGVKTPGIVNSRGDAFTFLFGPRFSYRGQHDRVVPFVQALAGGVHASEVTLTGCAAACTVLPAQSSFAMTAGGGLDLKLQKHLALRLFQAEYLMTRLADTGTGVSRMQNDMRLSTGLVFRFGGGMQHANGAPAVSCSADGDTLHAQASDPDGDLLTYQWSASAGRVDGNGASAHWDASGAAPGVYTVNVLVSDGRGGMADCSTNVHVDAAPNHPPMLACVADRVSIKAGDPLRITATASDPDQDPIVLAWETSGGRVVGSGLAIGIDTAGLPTGSITIHGRAFDGRGGAAECSVSIEVEGALPPAIVAVEGRLALHSIYFPTAQPTVEEPSRGILMSQQVTLQVLANDFKTYLEARPNAHLLLEGHADPRASDEYNQALTQRRVESTKLFLVEHGIPSANIHVRSLGDKENLTEAQVRQAVERNPELTTVERKNLLEKIQTVLLASNRRVDITLENTGLHSSREYPFNAKDSYTLLNQDQTKKPVHKTGKPAARAKR
ncbi:Outer membrane protein OmpA [Granulicella rosea]|uniref:Outer membrane protein OmpA n=1 Tax=Granulicella rosea TaxID=474952 RepID=A0A239MA08_9BACT|nr:OmpA family protein [Granulicella rosea]SNT38923.1 Outer membrane protein OmpA [Granulicella rosea]